MATITVTLQDVNGDPATDGGNINITTGSTPGAIFNEPSGTVSLSTVETNDTVEIGGVAYSYTFLGAGDVRGDANQYAAFIRIDGPAGAALPAGTTYAIDLTGQPGDADYPNLQNGNTKLQVNALNTTAPVQFPGVPCFTTGTRITTDNGNRRVEDIRPGDLVKTHDNGLQQVLWSGHTEVDAQGDLAPIEFAPGVIGNRRPLRVSPQHRVLVRRPQLQLLFGTSEMLVAAKFLINGRNVRRVEGGRVGYHHILCARHQLLRSYGAWSESLYLGAMSIGALPDAAVQEIRTLFPDLSDRLGREPAARPMARKFEADLIDV